MLHFLFSQHSQVQVVLGDTTHEVSKFVILPNSEKYYNNILPLEE